MRNESVRQWEGHMLLRALWGVSSSAPMPKYPEYVAAVEALKQCSNAYNPSGQELGQRLLELIVRRGADVAAQIPWHEGEVTWARLISAITSFTDDYSGPFPAEFFSEVRVMQTLNCLELAAREAGRPLNIIEQFEIALDVCQNSTFGAAVTLHAAARVVARGRDTRALPNLRLSLGERLQRSRAFAAFQDADSLGGDPLGDTYHYWAMVVGGIWCGDLRRANSIHARATALFLRNGADLMYVVRDRLFGSTLFFGRHKSIDRLGLAHGVALSAIRL